jgi:invasion protein IalB
VKHVVSRAALTFGLRVAIVLFGAGVGGWAVANESDPTPPAEAAKSNDDGKLVCKQEPVMGSNIKKKTCRTQKQLDEQREASKGVMESINQAQGRSNGSGG